MEGGSLTSALAFCEWRYLHSLISTNHYLDCHQDRSHDEGSCACALHMASTIPFWYHGGRVTNKALWPCVCEKVSINTCIHYPAELMPWSINIKWRPSKPAFSAKHYCITTYILIISQERGGNCLPPPIISNSWSTENLLRHFALRIGGGCWWGGMFLVKKSIDFSHTNHRNGG